MSNYNAEGITAGNSASSNFLPIDYIDLTEDSPINKARSFKRCNRNVATNTSEHTNLNSRHKRKTTNTNKRQESYVLANRITCNNVTCTDEIVILDDSIYIPEDDKHYATETDNGDSLPLKCPICLELLGSKLKPTTTRCGHIFCLQCLKTVIHTFKKCPTCKTTITLKSCTRLFI